MDWDTAIAGLSPADIAVAIGNRALVKIQADSQLIVLQPSRIELCQVTLLVPLQRVGLVGELKPKLGYLLLVPSWWLCILVQWVTLVLVGC